MFSLAKIVLPVDFSERSMGAARYVEVLAGRFGSEVILLHVLAPPHYEFSALEVGGTMLNELFAARSAQLRSELDAFQERELAHIQTRRLLLEGDPARKIVEFAQSEKAGVIVMPTHGYGPFRRFILGSVTAKVLHDADCPVWTGVHIEETPSVDKIHFRKVMIAIDLCPGQALKALSWGAQFAETFGAQLIVAHAYPSLEGRAGEYFDPNWRNYFTNIAAEEINKMQAKLGMKAEVILEGGDVPHVICNLAQTHNADAMVIGRGSAAGMFGRLRANAYALIRQSPCAVISV